MNGIWRCSLSSKKCRVHEGGHSHTPIHIIPGFCEGTWCSPDLPTEPFHVPQCLSFASKWWVGTCPVPSPLFQFPAQVKCVCRGPLLAISLHSDGSSHRSRGLDGG